ncbi:C45 family autoproteolytic acyltransferase/hydolase [Streptomyces sp. NPDC005784]|uniref:C45 family autoproteolytic acyltransferase/hydolase n=1 Tax=Streptomyces sp. NPDC005784 TaxID=3364731 RepID=UPI003682B618
MSVAYVKAAGTPFELGRTHGAALAGPLRGFLRDGLARLEPLADRPLTFAGLLPSITTYRAEITAAVPDLAEEVAGLAAGAGISEDEAWLLQLRREVMGYTGVPSAGDCTAYARTGPAARPVLAQTVDLNADIDSHIAVLSLARAGGPRRVTVLSFAGLLGYLGMNSDGLAIGLNLVTDGLWRPGVTPYLTIRHLLDRAGSVDEALEILAGLTLSSSRNLVLCDRRRAVYAEVCGTGLRVTEPASREAVHTNHYLHEDFTPLDRQSAPDRVNSDDRLEAVTKGLAGLDPQATAEEHFAVLCRPPVCIADHGIYRLERTVASAVMLPGAGELHLRAGDPNHGATEVFAV